MNVTQTAPSAVLTDFTGVTDPSGQVALSADSLLNYCSSRLETLDTNINQYFAEQQKKNKAMADAAKLVAQVATFFDGVSTNAEIQNNKSTFDGHIGMANGLTAVYANTEDFDVRAKCADAFHAATGKDINQFIKDGKPVPFKADDLKQSLAANFFGDKRVSRETWNQRIEDIKSVQGNLSKSCEMNMIQLQSLVSQRQMAVQLTTQLMQTMQESSKQVLGNIR
jgi:hypothetical protein